MRKFAPLIREKAPDVHELRRGADFYHSPGWNKGYAQLQVLTVAELLAGKGIDMPPLGQVNVTFKRAPKVRGDGAHTMELPLEQ